jgi:hypothetical protein
MDRSSLFFPLVIRQAGSGEPGSDEMRSVHEREGSRVRLAGHGLPVLQPVSLARCRAVNNDSPVYLVMQFGYC